MPTRFNSQTTQNAAKELAENLGSPYLVVPISKILESVQTTLSESCFERSAESLNVEGIHYENLQARTRSGAVLATIASVLNAAFMTYVASAVNSPISYGNSVSRHFTKIKFGISSY